MFCANCSAKIPSRDVESSARRNSAKTSEVRRLTPKESQIPSRRLCLGMGLSCLGISLVAPENTLALSDMIDDAKKVEFGPFNGSIRKCPTNVNPNCVSTASTNDTYGPTWRSREKALDKAVDRIIQVVPEVCPGAELNALQSLDDGQYVSFRVDGLFGKDIVEFIVRNDTTASRQWDGDVEGPIVSYRGIAGSVKYIYPISQPISDLGAQRKRLDKIRSKLGWNLVGCELIECYQ